jgi:hypothetical protein
MSISDAERYLRQAKQVEDSDTEYVRKAMEELIKVVKELERKVKALS